MIQWQYLECWSMHNSSERGFEHHGNAGAYCDNDHDPVQVSNQTQQVTANDTQGNAIIEMPRSLCT